MLGWESGKAKELQDACPTFTVYPTSCSSHKHHRRQHQHLAHVAKGKNCQISLPTAINMQPNTSGGDQSSVCCIITGQKVARHVAHHNQAGTSMKPRNFFPEMLPWKFSAPHGQNGLKNSWDSLTSYRAYPAASTALAFEMRDRKLP